MTIQPISDQLDDVQVGAQIQFNGNNMAYVIGHARLDSKESSDGGSSWATRNAAFYDVINLGDGQVLLNFPSKDKGSMVWFQMKVVDAANIAGFIQPHAKDFGSKKQGVKGKTFFIWDEGGPTQEKFQMLDLGLQDWKAEGKGILRGNGECRHVLAISVDNPGKYFFVLDSIKGEGEDVLLMGSLFNPEDAVESIN